MVSEQTFLGMGDTGSRTVSSVEHDDVKQRLVKVEESNRALHTDLKEFEAKQGKMFRNMNRSYDNMISMAAHLLEMLKGDGSSSQLGNEVFSDSNRIPDQGIESLNSAGNSMAITKLPEIDFPYFNGGDPGKWLRKVNEIFRDLPEFVDRLKFEVVEKYMEGQAWSWFYVFSHTHPNVVWELFSAELCKRFSGEGTKIVEASVKLELNKPLVHFNDAIQTYQGPNFSMNANIDVVDTTKNEGLLIQVGHALEYVAAEGSIIGLDKNIPEDLDEDGFGSTDSAHGPSNQSKWINRPSKPPDLNNNFGQQLDCQSCTTELHKIDFSCFNGIHPVEWILKAEKYFQIHQIAEENKLEWAAMFLKGGADVWFHGFISSNPMAGWSLFTTSVCRKFEETRGKEVIVDFPKINQTKNMDRAESSIGIMAHINAGKMATTEQILHYTNRNYKIDEVLEGTMTMDWMEQEQETVITITSAATTTCWKKHRSSIINTPSHVDINHEVACALRILDGAVCLCDGVANVEPQSQTVWRQAEKYGTPGICYANKLDCVGANFFRTRDVILTNLGAKPLVLQIPISVDNNSKGVVDLLTMKANVWPEKESGSKFSYDDISENLKELAQDYRSQLIESVVRSDDETMENYLEGVKTDDATLKKLIRSRTFSGSFVQVLYGWDFKNKEVQPLLDAVVAYLPSPFDFLAMKGTDPVFRIANMLTYNSMISWLGKEDRVKLVFGSVAYFFIRKAQDMVVSSEQNNQALRIQDYGEPHKVAQLGAIQYCGVQVFSTGYGISVNTILAIEELTRGHASSVDVKCSIGNIQQVNLGDKVHFKGEGCYE